MKTVRNKGDEGHAIILILDLFGLNPRCRGINIWLMLRFIQLETIRLNIFIKLGSVNGFVISNRRGIKIGVTGHVFHTDGVTLVEGTSKKEINRKSNN